MSSYATVTAAVVLFLALGGTSYAFIVNGALVQDESLTGADVRNGSLKGVDVDEATFDQEVPRAGVARQASPSGPAGGALTGQYPNPELADGATLSEIRDDDGAGSGLDADRLDGADLADLVPSGPYYLGPVTLRVHEAFGQNANLRLNAFNPSAEPVTVGFTILNATAFASTTSNQTIPGRSSGGVTFNCTDGDCSGMPLISSGSPIIPSALLYGLVGESRELSGGLVRAATVEPVFIPASGFMQLTG